MIGSCTAIAILALLIQQILLSAQLVRVADRMPTGGEYLAREIASITREVLATSFLLVLPLIVAVALSASARTSGRREGDGSHELRPTGEPLPEPTSTREAA